MTRLLNGDIVVPLTTYFTIGTAPLPPSLIERIEKDEDVSRTKLDQPFTPVEPVLNTFSIIDLREPTLFRQAQHQHYFRRHPNCYSWWRS